MKRSSKPLAWHRRTCRLWTPSLSLSPMCCCVTHWRGRVPHRGLTLGVPLARATTATTWAAKRHELTLGLWGRQRRHNHYSPIHPPQFNMLSLSYKLPHESNTFIVFPSLFFCFSALSLVFQLTSKFCQIYRTVSCILIPCSPF